MNRSNSRLGLDRSNEHLDSWLAKNKESKDYGDFKPGDIVAANVDGAWLAIVVGDGGVKEKDGTVIIDGFYEANPVRVETQIYPEKQKFKKGDAINYSKSYYQIGEVEISPEGIFEYQLINTSDQNDVIDHVAQPVIEGLEMTREVRQASVEPLLARVSEASRDRQQTLFKKLGLMERLLNEMEHSFGNSKQWAQLDREQVESVRDEVKKIKDRIDIQRREFDAIVHETRGGNEREDLVIQKKHTAESILDSIDKRAGVIELDRKDEPEPESEEDGKKKKDKDKKKELTPEQKAELLLEKRKIAGAQEFLDFESRVSGLNDDDPAKILYEEVEKRRKEQARAQGIDDFEEDTEGKDKSEAALMIKTLFDTSKDVVQKERLQEIDAAEEKLIDLKDGNGVDRGLAQVEEALLQNEKDTTQNKRDIRDLDKLIKKLRDEIKDLQKTKKVGGGKRGGRAVEVGTDPLSLEIQALEDQKGLELDELQRQIKDHQDEEVEIGRQISILEDKLKAAAYAEAKKEHDAEQKAKKKAFDAEQEKKKQEFIAAEKKKHEAEQDKKEAAFNAVQVSGDATVEAARKAHEAEQDRLQAEFDAKKAAGFPDEKEKHKKREAVAAKFNKNHTPKPFVEPTFTREAFDSKKHGAPKYKREAFVEPTFTKKKFAKQDFPIKKAEDYKLSGDDIKKLTGSNKDKFELRDKHLAAIADLMAEKKKKSADFNDKIKEKKKEREIF